MYLRLTASVMMISTPALTGTLKLVSRANTPVITTGLGHCTMSITVKIGAGAALLLKGNHNIHNPKSTCSDSLNPVVADTLPF